jgi:hypothetical protein
MDESERAEAMMMSTCISKSAVRGAELIISTTFTQHFTHNLKLLIIPSLYPSFCI